MLIAFQVVLLFIILIGFIGALGEKENENLRSNLTIICVVSIIALVVTFL